MKTKILVLGAVILFVLIWFTYHNYLIESGNAIHIAFAGPPSGEGAVAGRLMSQAIQLYFDEINEKGGINGKKLILTPFDDQNSAKIAKQKALEISKQNAVAVIGHWYSSASISAGEIYKKYQIPAITPGSVNINVTKGNEWYFRNIYNATDSGQFLANYVKYVFKQDKVSIIREQAAYGSYLADVFEQECDNLGMEIQNRWDYNNDAPNLTNRFQQIVDELESKKEEAGVILLAVQATQAVELVRLIRDQHILNQIIGGSSLSEETFRNGFDNFSIEKNHPGFYTNDIHIATPLIFDTANENAQEFKETYQAEYGEAPDWSAAYAYDTAMILVKAIEKAEIQGTPSSLQSDRQKIRKTLASFIDIYEAIEGVTGYNYFDTKRDAQKQPSIGVYKNKSLVSALTQFQAVRHTNEIADLEQAQIEERVLFINGKYMYKTNVVYVGLSVIEIGDIDIKNLQFSLDFKLWFRFQGDFNPANIEFFNVFDKILNTSENCTVFESQNTTTLNPLSMDRFNSPLEVKNSKCNDANKYKEVMEQLKQPIETKIKDNITYHVYRIKGRFRADFLPNYFAYKQNLVGVSFRHRFLTRKNLIYVTDVLGMGLAEEKSLVDRLTKNHVLSPASGWLMTSVRFFPKIVKENSAGDPDHLNVPEGMVEYSRFNAAIQIKKDQFTLRGIIPYKYAQNLMIVSGILFLLLTFFVRSKQTLFKFLIWLFQVIFASLLLLSGEIRFADWLAENVNTSQLKSIVKVFDILWWLIPAFLINVASERFIWTPLEEKLGAMPNIIRHFFALLVYFLALIGIIVFVYEQSFTSLLAASGMIAMIIGLAIQINISNVFSGIVINMERPFRIGDWVKIGQFEEGEIIDINWRATRIKARNGCMTSIPNSIAAESAILNFYYPDEVYWLWPTVYVHPRHPPARVKKILLDALLSSDIILKDPKPVVIFTSINEWAACYWIAFCADDYGNKYFILEEVWTRVWFHLSRADISPAVMRQEIHVFEGDNSRGSGQSAMASKSPIPTKNASPSFVHQAMVNKQK